MLFYPAILIGCAAMLGGLVLSRKGHPRGGSITVIAAIVCVTLGASRLLWPPDARDDHPVKVKEAHFAAIAVERLAMHLAQHHAGAQAIIILPFEWRTSEAHRQAMSAALKRGLSDQIQVLATIDPPLPQAVKKAYESRYNSADMEQVEIPDFASWFTASYFDGLVEAELSKAATDKATIIVSLAGLPEDSTRLRILRGSVRPKLAAVFGPVYALKNLIARGDIIAATDHHPAPNHEAQPPEEEIATAFDRRYLLITPENLAEMQQKHQLFQ